MQGHPNVHLTFVPKNFTVTPLHFTSLQNKITPVHSTSLHFTSLHLLVFSQFLRVMTVSFIIHKQVTTWSSYTGVRNPRHRFVRMIKWRSSNPALRASFEGGTSSVCAHIGIRRLPSEIHNEAAWRRHAVWRGLWSKAALAFRFTKAAFFPSGFFQCLTFEVRNPCFHGLSWWHRINAAYF